MPISNEHLKRLVQTWDGTSYAMMDIKKAKSLAKKGQIQITTNLAASDLKRPQDFKIPKQLQDDDRRKDDDQVYQHREMKAASK